MKKIITISTLTAGIGASASWLNYTSCRRSRINSTPIYTAIQPTTDKSIIYLKINKYNEYINKDNLFN